MPSRIDVGTSQLNLKLFLPQATTTATTTAADSTTKTITTTISTTAATTEFRNKFYLGEKMSEHRLAAFWAFLDFFVYHHSLNSM